MSSVLSDKQSIIVNGPTVIGLRPKLLADILGLIPGMCPEYRESRGTLSLGLPPPAELGEEGVGDPQGLV